MTKSLFYKEKSSGDIKTVDIGYMTNFREQFGSGLQIGPFSKYIPLPYITMTRSRPGKHVELAYADIIYTMQRTPSLSGINNLAFTPEEVEKISLKVYNLKGFRQVVTTCRNENDLLEILKDEKSFENAIIRSIGRYLFNNDTINWNYTNSMYNPSDYRISFNNRWFRRLKTCAGYNLEFRLLTTIEHDGDNFLPHIFPVVRREDLLYHKLYVLLNQSIDLSKVIVFINRGVDIPNGVRRGFKIHYNNYELEEKIKQTSAHIWKVPLDYIIDNCFIHPNLIVSKNIIQRKKDKKLILDRYRERFVNGELRISA